MPRKNFNRSSDSDSSDDEEVNFKRAKKHREISPPRTTSQNNAPFRRPIPSTLSSSTSNNNIIRLNGSSSSYSRGLDDQILSNPQSTYNNRSFRGKKYVDLDQPDDDASTKYPVRNLASPNSVKPIISQRNGIVNLTGNQKDTNMTTNVTTSSSVIQKPNTPPPNKELSSNEIMISMGFQKGQGLAKFLSEVKKPDAKFSLSEFEEKADALGIGLADMELITLDDVFLDEYVKWTSSKDIISNFNIEELMENRKVGPVITSVEIDHDNALIDPSVYTELVNCKKLYQNMSESMYQKIRAKANLFERVSRGPFLSRAAMKMANLDTILKFELTQPKSPDGLPSIDPNSLFYFADVCAGPGGFTEYILWKKKWEAKGFGLTLKGDLDFDVKNFNAAEPETFEAFYGDAGDGNIYNPRNVAGYIDHVLASTEGNGVHLMMADGGFTVSKQENLQEVLSHQIILSQILVALSIVRDDGHFICKLFDTVTPFTVALIYFAYHSFNCIAVHKPLTSRPANSERYLICKWKKSKQITLPIKTYLLNCHELMWKLMNKEGRTTILELLNISTITDTRKDPFYFYIKDCNNGIAGKQIETFKRMVAFVKDQSLENEKNQEKARKKALQYWSVPEKITRPAMMRNYDDACTQLLQELPSTMLKHGEKDLVPSSTELLIRSAYDWRFVPVSGVKRSSNRGFYMSLGQQLVYRYNGCEWVIIAQRDPVLELPSRTLVYGEFAHELYGKGDLKIVEAFHIIDALVLGGVDLRHMHYTQRLETSLKFAKAVTRPMTLPVRAKTPIRMENLAGFTATLEHRVVKGAGNGLKLVCPLDINNTEPHCPFVIPEGILFLKITRDPWQMALNRNTCKKYFFNTLNGVASEHVPGDAISGFFNTMGNRVLWTWDKETNVTLAHLEPNDPRIQRLNSSRLHTCQLVNYINYTINQRPSVSLPKSTLYVGGTQFGERREDKEDKTVLARPLYY